MEVPTALCSIVQIIEWDSGHRVLGHQGKCQHLHGHRYKAEIEVERVGQDPLGMVMDFSDVKSLIKEWIDKNWDHNFLAHPEDPITKLGEIAANEDPPWSESSSDVHQMYRIMRHLASDVLSGKKPHTMRYGNPTAENIAMELLSVSQELLGGSLSSIQVVSVTVWETPNCRAIARPGDLDGNGQAEHAEA